MTIYTTRTRADCRRYPVPVHMQTLPCIRTRADVTPYPYPCRCYPTPVPVQTLPRICARAETFDAMVRVFGEVRELSGGAEGPLPPRPDYLLPHTGQSLVDAYWCRLGAVSHCGGRREGKRHRDGVVMRSAQS